MIGAIIDIMTINMFIPVTAIRWVQILSFPYEERNILQQIKQW